MLRLSGFRVNEATNRINVAVISTTDSSVMARVFEPTKNSFVARVTQDIFKMNDGMRSKASDGNRFDFPRRELSLNSTH